MSFLQRCIWPHGSDENLHLADRQDAETRYSSWLVMSPIEFPGREPGTVTFSRRHWKRQFFELSLVRGQTTQDTNRFHLICYSKNDRNKRPKGCIDLNTVTDLRKMSVPPDELLATLSRKHLCEDCQLMDADPRRRVLICDQLPFFSFEAMFGEHRGRVYLLAEDARQMLDWLRLRHARRSKRETPRNATCHSITGTPVAPLLPIPRPWGGEVNANTNRRRSGSPDGRHQPVVDSAVDFEIYNTDETYGVVGGNQSADETYGNLLSSSRDDTYGELLNTTGDDTYGDFRNAGSQEDDGLYGRIDAASLKKKMMTTTAPGAAVARESVDSGAFDAPPSIAPRQFRPQNSGKGVVRQSSTDYENLNQLSALVGAANAPDNVYGNVSDMQK
uniref:IRS-type PTB domain-containing protein n=1 Tax=Macrostomum lignano TaxID=282301 RepID=A0A1I8G0V8_9PLAT